MTPQQNYTTLRDEFIADYIDRHGDNQATRDEANDLADEWTDVARDAVQFARLAVNRAWSEWFQQDIEDVAIDAAALIYDDSEYVCGRPNVISAAIKLAMSEGDDA